MLPTRRLLRKKTVFLCTFASVFFVMVYTVKQNRPLMFSGITLQPRSGKHFSPDYRKIVKIKEDADDRFVVFNRVPKCASMSMTTLCYKLGAENGFKVASPYEEGEKPGRTESEQKKFIQYLRSQKSPYMYIRHQYFIDFEKFDEKQPVYINMIRDPIARFESFYYFSRFGNRHGGGASARMDDTRRRETIDECVKNRRPECTKPYWQVVPYFCGQAPGCMSRSQWAVDRAKNNIEKHYLFIGTVEDLDDSLKILNHILPSYFKNAHEYIKSPASEKMRNQTLTVNKKTTSEATKRFLKTQTSLALEYQLYDFVRDRLSKLKESVFQQ